MPSNIEIKARDRDPAALAAAAREMADGPARQFVQRDTFFRVTRGRLKLRECGAGSGELIWYDRPGGSGSRRSEYLISPVADADSLRAVLGRADGVLRVVEKTRTLYRVGQTRIHLDDVVGLGRFVELEVVLRDGQPEEEGHAIAAALMARLGIDRADLLGEAYADMLPDPR